MEDGNASVVVTGRTLVEASPIVDVSTSTIDRRMSGNIAATSRPSSSSSSSPGTSSSLSFGVDALMSRRTLSATASQVRMSDADPTAGPPTSRPEVERMLLAQYASFARAATAADIDVRPNDLRPVYDHLHAAAAVVFDKYRPVYPTAMRYSADPRSEKTSGRVYPQRRRRDDDENDSDKTMTTTRMTSAYETPCSEDSYRRFQHITATSVEAVPMLASAQSSNVDVNGKLNRRLHHPTTSTAFSVADILASDDDSKRRCGGSPSSSSTTEDRPDDDVDEDLRSGGDADENSDSASSSVDVDVDGGVADGPNSTILDGKQRLSGNGSTSRKLVTREWNRLNCLVFLCLFCFRIQIMLIRLY